METVVDTCERELRRWIVRGEVRPGERLPPERTLATRLGVNRTTLRSALTRLATARLVRVRQGSGYVVQDFSKVAGLELVGELANDSDGSQARLAADLLRVRRAVLAMALDDLTERRPDATRVAETVGRIRALVGEGAGCMELAEAEHELMSIMLSAGRTPVLSLSFNGVCFAVRSMPRLCDAMYADPNALVEVATLLLRCAEQPSASAIQAALDAMDARDRSLLALLGRPRPIDHAPVATHAE